MATIPFTKMHGLGNDFVLINGLNEDLPDLRKLTDAICHRRFGIGCDQVLIVHPATRADFRMQILNNDGSEVEMCGNGIRAFMIYLREQGLTNKEELSIETLGGIIHPRLIGDEIEVDMGEPILKAEKIPVKSEGMIINHKEIFGDKEFYFSCVSMGNPHCVIFVDHVENFPVKEYGPIIERHPLFPNRINVEFVEVLTPQHLRMKVWERGAGQTLACGTGACASLVAGVLTGRCERESILSLDGGNLKIKWDENNNRVYMTGPATTVFKGEIEIK